MAEPSLIPCRGEVPFEASPRTTSRESILEAWQDHCEEKKLRPFS
jgi:hypothetical protein